MKTFARPVLLQDLRAQWASRQGSQKGQYRLGYHEAGVLFRVLEMSRSYFFDGHTPSERVALEYRLKDALQSGLLPDTDDTARKSPRAR